jgi:CRP/FNR family transcriptional regulator
VHPAIEAALALREQGLDAGQIESLAVYTYADALAFADCPQPGTDHQARFSLQHAVAVACWRGDMTLHDSGPSARSDSQVAQLRARVQVHEDVSLTQAYPGRFGARLVARTADGRDQVTGFQMAGEIIGLDGIVNDQHSCDAVALEDAEVCVMPFDRIEEISREVTALQHHVHKIMSREIVREHGVMLLLGSMRAEERLAAFLLNLVQRLHARGFSQSELVLRMTREEIGSFLGLKLETVSRTFSKFVEDGTVEVKQRHVRILDTNSLQRLVNNNQCH